MTLWKHTYMRNARKSDQISFIATYITVSSVAKVLLFIEFAPCIYGMYYSSQLKIPHSRMTKYMQGNNGDLFVICMQQVIKGHLYHLLGYRITL